MMKHLLLSAVALSFGITASAAGKARQSAPVTTCDDVILHAWCWSFNTIKNNMKDIAEAGYRYVQTSPAQECVTQAKGDKGGGNQIYGHGRWYYHYQPTDWKIGNYQLGTRDDFKAMCDEARKYGVDVIVDVLPNHTSIDDTRVSDALDAAVGGHENLYHANGFDEIRDYNDRLQCTTGQMGGLPDVNTENPDFQYYYMTYVNDLLACGARGFRYDTAKHIGLPSDPLDPKSKQNDFWNVALGRKTVKGLRMSLPADSLFIYGEVLQDRNVKEAEYAEYMKLTASSYGHVVRKALEKSAWHADNIGDWCHPANPAELVTWVESHDTYCNAHESAGLSDDQIKVAWVFITARQFGTPLFYNRPDGSTRDNVWGNNIVGLRGNDNFKNPEVVAANKFRRAMHGQAESVAYSTDDKVAVVSRGNRGAAVVNLSADELPISVATTLKNGKYRDVVYGTQFTVKKGILTGTVKPLTTYVLQSK
ncbi:MAG: alpha-amylase family glycosyl hydrolase [Muribaculaceae bacterium]